jgi:hypothetical protein
VRVERGVKRFKVSRRCVVFGENALEWMLSLSRRDWSDIAWLPSLTSTSEELELTEGVLKLMNGRRVLAGQVEKTLRDADLYLGAGPRGSLAEDLKPLDPTVLTILLVSGEWMRRGVFKNWQGRSFTHEQVGGVTDWRGTARTNLRAMPVLPETVKRNLSHVLEHGDRPTPCCASLDFPHLSVNELLPLNESVLLDVAFHTYSSRTNWGRRQLNDKEIAGAMDLPLWFSMSPLFGNWSKRYDGGSCIPLKPFQTILKLFPVDDKAVSDVVSVVETSMRREGSDNEVEDDFWIESLGVILPGTWVDAGVVSDKALKADDAAVHTRLWDQRILLVFPHGTQKALICFRAWAYFLWTQLLTACFKRFMITKHGVGWETQLCKLRRLRRLGAGSARTPHQGGEGYFNFTVSEFEAVDLDSKANVELFEDGNAGAEALSKGLNATWWEWSRGSALFFWRWELSQQPAARDGMEIFVRGKLPTNLAKGRGTRLDKMSAVGKKLNKVYERGYICEGPVESLIDYFDVEKGIDIRLVYNGTSCLLNEKLFAPSFWLPNATTASRPLMYYSWMADGDMGEMFLNFPMDKKLRCRSGIDVTQMAAAHMPSLPLSARLSQDRVLLRWERLFMGMRPSPYNAVRYFYWGEELARGNPKDLSNPFAYSEVVLNLPGMTSYDPTMPHVYKWNSRVKRVAGEMVTFIDDSRGCGYSKENTWQIMRRIASVLQYLGIQDAPRKRRPPSQSPGAWAGSLNTVTPEQVGLSVTQEKWAKGKGIVFALAEKCLGPLLELPDLCHKSLEKDRGFLTHLSMTFPAIVPVLKGLHLTIDQWRVTREADGWARSEKDHRAWMSHFLHTHEGREEEIYDLLNAEAPKTVKPVPRFLDDLGCLVRIFSSEAPPVIVLRSLFVFMVVYGFGDASGKGFGSTFGRGDAISYRIGIWGAHEEEESSNWREFTNVVEALEEEGEEGRLTNTKVYFFTDNSVTESAIYKGTSKSPKLLELVIRLKVLEVKYSIHLAVCHVAGTRMIAEGGDGVSRGLLNEGVMAGEDILSFIPLHQSAVERSTTFLPWLQTWIPQQVEVLTPMDWYELGHDIRGWTRPVKDCLFARPVLRKGVFGWFPPPAAADVALEQLRIARNKRQDSTHVIVVPKLLTPEWLKQLWKACDIVLTIPAGTTGWADNMYEPVLIGICFPFLRVDPWQLRGTPKMFCMERQLRRVFKEDGVDPGPLLCKFWLDCHRMQTLQADVVSRMLYFVRDSNFSHSPAGRRSHQLELQRRRRGQDDVSMAPKEKKQRCV